MTDYVIVDGDLSDTLDELLKSREEIGRLKRVLGMARDLIVSTHYHHPADAAKKEKVIIAMAEWEV